MNNSTDEYRFIIPDAENQLLREFVVGSSGLIVNGSFTANTFSVSADLAVGDLVGVQVIATGTGSGDVHVYINDIGPTTPQVRHYTLTTWNNISTMTFQQAGDMPAANWGYSCVSPDGTSILGQAYAGDDISFNTMSTAFDVSTLGTWTTAKGVVGNLPQMVPDGSAFFVFDYGVYTFARYSLAHAVRLLSSTGGSRFAQYYDSSNLTDGGDTTQQITGGSYITNNNGIIESGQMGRTEYGVGDSGLTAAEYEWTVRLKSADWSNLTHCLLFGVDSAPLDDSEGRVAHGPDWTNWPFVVKDTAGATQTINANSVADAAAVSNPQIQNLLSIVDAPDSIPAPLEPADTDPSVVGGVADTYPFAGSWTNIANILSDTTNYSSWTGSLNTSFVTWWVYADTFGISLPADAVVTGVRVDLRKLESQMKQLDVALFNNGVPMDLTGEYHWDANGLADEPTVVSVGGLGDTQGQVLTKAIVEGSQFGVGFRGHSNDSISGTGSIRIYVGKLTIYYDTGTSVGEVSVVPGQVQIQADSVADAAAVGSPTINTISTISADSVTDAASVGSPAASIRQGIYDVSGDNASQSNETNIVINGYGFGASQGTSKVFLADDPVLLKATVAVEQTTVSAWSDTQITLSSWVTTGMPASATLYVIVERAN